MYKIYWDQENRVIHVSVSGKTDKVVPSSLREKFLELLNSQPGKLNVLVECQQAHVDLDFLKELKKIKAGEEEKETTGRKIKYVAIFGLGFLQRLELELMLAAGGLSEKIRLFNNEEDALNWFGEV